MSGRECAVCVVCSIFRNSVNLLFSDSVKFSQSDFWLAADEATVRVSKAICGVEMAAYGASMLTRKNIVFA